MLPAVVAIILAQGIYVNGGYKNIDMFVIRLATGETRPRSTARIANNHSLT